MKNIIIEITLVAMLVACAKSQKSPVPDQAVLRIVDIPGSIVFAGDIIAEDKGHNYKLSRNPNENWLQLFTHTDYQIDESEIDFERVKFLCLTGYGPDSKSSRPEWVSKINPKFVLLSNLNLNDYMDWFNSMDDRSTKGLVLWGCLINVDHLIALAETRGFREISLSIESLSSHELQTLKESGVFQIVDETNPEW